MKLSEIQPSQLFISSEKLARVLQDFSQSRNEPLPVKRLNDLVIYTDGHTRALAAYLFGLSEIDVCWDEDELDWQAYQICVDWCLGVGIQTVADLVGRVIPAHEYNIKWLARCDEMHTKLARQRQAAQKH
ncbi:hypothetical protein ACFLZW_01685 [Chloroflexota bacterium]